MECGAEQPVTVDGLQRADRVKVHHHRGGGKDRAEREVADQIRVCRVELDVLLVDLELGVGMRFEREQLRDQLAVQR